MGAYVLLRVRMVVVTVTLGMVDSPLSRRIPEGKYMKHEGKRDLLFLHNLQECLERMEYQLPAFVPSNMLCEYKKTPIGGC